MYLSVLYSIFGKSRLLGHGTANKQDILFFLLDTWRLTYFVKLMIELTKSPSFSLRAATALARVHPA